MSARKLATEFETVFVLTLVIAVGSWLMVQRKKEM
jgi:hypothetical protein